MPGTGPNAGHESIRTSELAATPANKIATVTEGNHYGSNKDCYDGVNNYFRPQEDRYENLLGH